MSQVNGITDFLDQAGTEFRVFDMGRRIQPIDKAQFLAFEQGEAPYPLPLQQQAWLGFIVWSEDKQDELIIWFIRFPLDANGMLTQGIRDDFVLRLIQKDGQTDTDETHPYGYKPKQEHMACFHAKAAKLIGQPASSYYEHARDYFDAKPGFDQWAFVGFQGIADICARLDENANTQRLASAIPQIPPQPFEALAQCLEHEPIDSAISQAIVSRLDMGLQAESPDANTISMCIRALSNTQDTKLLQQQLERVLSSAVAGNAEVLASISGRCWLALQQQDTMALFLEALAGGEQGQEFFNLVIVDLINIPGMQQSIHTAVRSTDRSAKLSLAIGELFKTFS